MLIAGRERSRPAISLRKDKPHPAKSRHGALHPIGVDILMLGWLAAAALAPCQREDDNERKRL